MDALLSIPTFKESPKNTLSSVIGAHSAGEIPVIIPNTEVKPSSADYTALRETRKVPNYQLSTRKGGFLICVVEMFGKKKPQP